MSQTWIGASGHTDDKLLGRWSEQSVFFVTRMKTNAPYEVVHTIPGGATGFARRGGSG